MCGDWIRLDDEIARIMEGLAVSAGRTAPTASAQTSPREEAGRATHNAGRETGVVNLDEWRSSRALSGAGPARLPMDDGHQARGCLGDHQPDQRPARSSAVRPKF